MTASGGDLGEGDVSAPFCSTMAYGAAQPERHAFICIHNTRYLDTVLSDDSRRAGAVRDQNLPPQYQPSGKRVPQHLARRLEAGELLWLSHQGAELRLDEHRFG